MEEKNKEKELILCSLLDAALHAEPHVENQAALKQKWERLKQQETEWESILSIADRHRVLPLLYDVLENILPEDGADWKRVQERSTQTVWQSYRLLFISRYVTGLLKDAGIDTILLKGSGVAGLYPVPELRKSGDVDLLVENGKMAQEAGRCLQVHGFVAESGHQENHHLTYMSPEGIRLELHSALVEPFDSTEVNTFLEKCQKDFFENRVTENVMGVDFSWPRHHIRHFICYYICCSIFAFRIWLKTSLRLGCILGTWMYGRGGSKIFNTGQRMRHLKFCMCGYVILCQISGIIRKQGAVSGKGRRSRGNERGGLPGRVFYRDHGSRGIW